MALPLVETRYFILQFTFGNGQLLVIWIIDSSSAKTHKRFGTLQN